MTSTFLADAAVRGAVGDGVQGELVHVDGRDWYEIRDYDRLPPFFMSLVSSADHWWFVSSSGGMTAGRVDADQAFLPYETVDRVTLGIDQTGPLTILRVHDGGERAQLWEPLSRRTPVHRLSRKLRKSVEGDALTFEEQNHDLELSFQMTLRFGDRVGFVRTVQLLDTSGRARRIDVLDGYRNVLPHGASEQMQQRMSALLDAYKRNERDPETGVAFYSLSSILTDKAEASEALRAHSVWSAGLSPSGVLLTPDERIDAFRRGEDIVGDTDVRGQRGAFLVNAQLELGARQGARWHVVAEVSCDAKAAGRIRAWQRDHDVEQLEALIQEDTERGTLALRDIVGRADGVEVGGDALTTTHHFANTLFNVMRGGVFVDGHNVETRDFATFVATRNVHVRQSRASFLEELPATIHIGILLEKAEATADVDLIRLVLEYLPLTFSRRHGDPSRPWNKFSIRLRNDDGTPRTDYQGNWRDIFQNWEPLAYAYPAFAFSMVAKFLNATTLDGYNPYRVTRDGIEWEEPEPDNPWSNLGYWGDHQIIYLQKLLEVVEGLEPGRLRREWDRAGFTYADVPYRLASYDAMVRDWSDTVAFDDHANEATEERVEQMGTDGRLVRAAAGETGTQVHHVTMVEKLLVLLLAKLTNLVPGGGIWMNTQRPEWNDANNALVGKGVSVVTTAYLRRFVSFWTEQLAGIDDDQAYRVSPAVAELTLAVSTVLETHRASLTSGVDDTVRRTVMDALGAAATAYREQVYAGVTNETVGVTRAKLAGLLEVSQQYIDHALGENRRSDGLYHGYLVLRLDEGTAGLEPLDLMLEGQVAMLSSGFLSPDESLAALRALPKSALYWPAQHTYLLYPNRDLPGFLGKNRFAAARVETSELVSALSANGDDRLAVVDPYDGHAHFGGDLRNADDLGLLLDALGDDPRYAPYVNAERQTFLDLFEEVFDHSSFTGRSGTFFAYEGLGSVYWHMVSKLLLAAQESYFHAVDSGADADVQRALADAYYDVRAGLGFQKTPEEFGAFPTDPYSHTPETGRARQPGMTGQVKEELLTRLGELGVRVQGGVLRFEPHLLSASERLEAPSELAYLDRDGEARTVTVPKGGLAFTFAQTPIVYDATGDGPTSIRVKMSDGSEETLDGHALSRALSTHLFARDGQIASIHVTTRPGRD